MILKLLKLLRYEKERDKLPRLERSIKVDFEAGKLSRDEAIVLRSGLTRDRHGVKRLLARYNASSATELIERLPPPPRPDWRHRLLLWFHRLEGSQPEPHRPSTKSEYTPFH